MALGGSAGTDAACFGTCCCLASGNCIACSCSCLIVASSAGCCGIVALGGLAGTVAACFGTCCCLASGNCIACSCLIVTNFGAACSAGCCGIVSACPAGSAACSGCVSGSGCDWDGISIVANSGWDDGTSGFGAAGGGWDSVSSELSGNVAVITGSLF